jgi:hypothetical protein
MNLYDPPKASIGRGETDDLDPRAVALRRRNLGHERAFRAIATVNVLGAGLVVIFIAVNLFYLFKANGIWSGWTPGDRTFALRVLGLVFPALIIFHLALGWGLRRFEPWAFYAQVILSGAAILSFFVSWGFGWANDAFADFSIATAVLSGIAHFAILYYLLGTNARRLVSPDFREAVAETPHLRTRRLGPIMVGIIPYSLAFEWSLLSLARDVTRLIGWVIA